MEISKERLRLAAEKAGLSADQIEDLLKELSLEEGQKTSPFSTFLYYFGALIVISAMTWFLSISWEAFGGLALSGIAVAYGLFFLWLGNRLWKHSDLKIPGGLLITMSVCMVPLAIYGLESHFNIWPENPPGNYQDFFATIKGSWILMELGTILAALWALKHYSFPFLTAPLFFAAWFLTMDIIPLITREEASYQEREWLTLGFGFILLAIAYWMDLRRKNGAFWGYLFGTITFWGALSSICWDYGEGALFVYLLINLVLMLASLILKRKILMVFGGIGTFIYLSHLAYDLFKDSLFLPFALSLIGLVIIYLGVLYQKNSERIESAIQNKLPDSLKKFFP